MGGSSSSCHIQTVPENRAGTAEALRTAAVFTADGGDTFQGSALAAWTVGEAVLSPLNALGLDVGVPGNWDVVYGPEAFRRLFRKVRHTIVCYNFHDITTGQRLFDPAVVLERDGVRVAFVGMTDPTTSTRQPPAEMRRLDTMRTAGFREYVQMLRQREHPDLLVFVNHIGLAPSIQLPGIFPNWTLCSADIRTNAYPRRSWSGQRSWWSLER